MKLAILVVATLAILGRTWAYNNIVSPYETGRNTNDLYNERQILHGYDKRYMCVTLAANYLKQIRAPLEPILELIDHSRWHAKRRSVSIGCKFPFHQLVFECCKGEGGDCTFYKRKKALYSAIHFKRCMKKGSYIHHHDRSLKCWINAERAFACKRSDTSTWYMKMINNGTTW